MLVGDRPTAPAGFPPDQITGLDPDWSRLVEVVDAEGINRTWHVLDSWASRLDNKERPVLTLLCIHGNPSWSFLWRHVLSGAPENVRVIAMDQLDMGFSERTGIKRTLAMRIDDLHHLTRQLALTGPVVSVAHDWGGPVSLGWAQKYVPDPSRATNTAVDNASAWLAGIVLTNTAVHQPEASSAPSVIRLIRSVALLRLVTVHTKLFIRGAIAMSRPALGEDIRTGFNAPYLKASRRAAIADFVADIPLDASHESAATLDDIAAGMATLADIPALLLWGPRDKVFSDIYLHDLESRLPHAQVHRFPQAAHFVTEDANVSAAINAWIAHYVTGRLDTDTKPVTASDTRKLNSAEANAGNRALADFSTVNPDTEAVVEIAPSQRVITFGELASQVDLLAAGMAQFGIQPGQRVAVMVTPGIDLALTVYACWRLGATLVLVDSGLGKTGMQRALHSANPMYLVGIDKALIAARLLAWPGIRIAVGARSNTMKRILGIVSDLDALCVLGKDRLPLAWPSPDTVAAVAFTSGSTGPSKGVIYLHRQIQSQREVLMQLYSINPDDRLVAAFAPFALYGPTMGITSVVPDMDVTKPGSLTAKALAAAVHRVNATLVFASPAALSNVVHTGRELETSHVATCTKVRLALSAGAPVRASLLEEARQIFPDASFHTPYGMTEVLPIADISLLELQALEAQAVRTDLPAFNATAGVCVGYPVPGASIAIDPLDQYGVPTGIPVTSPNQLGEVIVRAAHIRHAYDRLWLTDHTASEPIGMHRTGDVGQLDESGRLWIGGRLGHVVVTPSGPLAPVACEQLIETLSDVEMAAVVGVGPPGTQAIVAVVQTAGETHEPGNAEIDLIDRVREKVQFLADVAAVLVVKHLPVDRRHDSKIDRTALALWAAKVLAGEKVPSP